MKIIFFLLFSSSLYAQREPQAQELLGLKKYQQLQVAKKSKNIKVHVLSILKKNLPAKYQSQAGLIAVTIIKNANKYNLDPLLVTAVISGESAFNPEIVGPVKEIGFMQLRPHVAKWITEELLKKKYQTKMLYNPYDNIRMGTRYLAWLRTRFSKSSHYLAAYNLGPGKVKELSKKDITPKDYPRHVMKRYLAYYKK